MNRDAKSYDVIDPIQNSIEGLITFRCEYAKTSYAPGVAEELKAIADLVKALAVLRNT